MILQRRTVENSTFDCVKRYLKNLLLALLGNNPYQVEMGEASDHLEKAAEALKTMQNLYDATMERWSESQKQLKQMQQLVETLRTHLREKDEQMKQLWRNYNYHIDQMKRDYEKRQNEE